MGDPTKSNEEKGLSVHPGLVLFFSRCSYIFYNPTPHRIPRTNDPNPPDSITCRQKVPIDVFERQEQEMIARKALIEGNSHIHEIEMVHDIARLETRDPDTHPGGGSAKHTDHLRRTMVPSATAGKYRAMTQFNLKWGVQFKDVVNINMPLDGATFSAKEGDTFTNEERRRFQWFLGRRERYHKYHSE